MKIKIYLDITVFVASRGGFGLDFVAYNLSTESAES